MKPTILFCLLLFFHTVHSQKKTHDEWDTEIGTITVYFSLEEALKNPESVKGLQLRDQGLNELPKEIGQLVNLQYLRVHHNNLTTIPEFIISLPKLRVLEIGGNHLGQLPEDLGAMTQLEYLGLKANGLLTLPESIGNLTHLKILDLDFNPLEYLPESIKNLTGLKRMHTTGNHFTKEEIEKNKQLLPNVFG
ncbi:leucine-rich repeat domain-containing protein [Maribacter luteus]|uniref:Leucine-rich repeat domain-containing protein n=1 Tax=Maribacter luteus TaxID=2594478 RepID=A0A6I2MUA4_9FLAO|nr:leucine-rich repeat domain-containing protein [Maribacter luteus]MRX65066.1 leucine-rich repeat domain-containing protein [Maribacter luteus]